MKRLSYLALTVLCSLNVAAQVVGTDSIKKKIREIKLSEQYVYAESGSAGMSEEEVRMLALDGLYVRMAEDMAALGKTKEEIKAARQQAEAHHSLLEYSNGTLRKAFAYISNGILTGTLTFEEKEQEEFITDDDCGFEGFEEKKSPTVTPSVTVDTEARKKAIADSLRMAREKAIADSLRMAREKAIADSLRMAREKAVADSLRLAREKVIEDSIKAAKMTPATPIIPEKDEQVVKEILALDNYEGIMLYLDGMKEDGRLMYGRLSALISPEEAYMIIIKESKLVTVLGQGKGERLNLRTLQPDELKNYKGYAVIWMKIYR